jgi:hypothetical protein
VVAAEVLMPLLQAAQAAPASSSFLTQAHNEALAAQLHQAVATPSIHF